MSSKGRGGNRAGSSGKRQEGAAALVGNRTWSGAKNPVPRRGIGDFPQLGLSALAAVATPSRRLIAPDHREWVRELA